MITKSGFFKPDDLKEVKFKLGQNNDRIEYKINIDTLLWEKLYPNEQDQRDENYNNASPIRQEKSQRIDKNFAALYGQNLIKIEKLEIDNQLLDDLIEKEEKKLTDIMIEQEKLIEEYVLEHLETQRVKLAREKLDQLRKEIGL